MITTTFAVADIHCASCENTIRTALFRLPGVARVVASAQSNDVQVSFDERQINDQQLKDKLSEVGYQPLDQPA